MVVLLLVDGLELTEVLWTNERRRPFAPRHDWVPGTDAPKVSIHVPCYNEPPHMVIETLDALARLDYPNFEVIVVDNNTKDEAVWKPLEAHCASLGPRFRFFHLPQWPGYKAGALNFALANTAQDLARRHAIGARRGGAQGVGSATTNAVVSSSIIILLMDYLLTSVFFS